MNRANQRMWVALSAVLLLARFGGCTGETGTGSYKSTDPLRPETTDGTTDETTDETDTDDTDGTDDTAGCEPGVFEVSLFDNACFQ